MKTLETLKLAGCGALAAFGILFATPVSAVPIHGQPLTLDLYFGGSFFPPPWSVTFTVDSTAGAVEVPNWGGVGRLSVDVFDVDSTHFSVLFTQLVSANYSPSPNLGVFTDTSSAIVPFLNVSIGASSAGWGDGSRVAFTSDSFSYDFGGISAAQGGFVRLDITTGSTSVPDSGSTLALLGAALAGLIWFQRRRTAAAI